MKRNFQKITRPEVIDLTSDEEYAKKLQNEEIEQSRDPSPNFGRFDQNFSLGDTSIVDTSKDEELALQLQLEFEQEEIETRKREVALKKREQEEAEEQKRVMERDRLLALQLQQEFEQESLQQPPLRNPHDIPQNFNQNRNLFGSNQNPGVSMNQILRDAEDRRRRERDLFSVPRPQFLREMPGFERPRVVQNDLERYHMQNFGFPDDDFDDHFFEEEIGRVRQPHVNDDLTYEQALALQERIGSVKVTVPKKDIDEITTKYELKGVPKEDPQCGICLLDYTKGDTLRLLPCGHKFHVDCIDGWLLEERNNCPICREEVKKQ